MPCKVNRRLSRSHRQSYWHVLVFWWHPEDGLWDCDPVSVKYARSAEDAAAAALPMLNRGPLPGCWVEAHVRRYPRGRDWQVVRFSPLALSNL